MSTEPAIRIEGLGKRYRLGQTVDLSRTFRETIMSIPGHLRRTFSSGGAAAGNGAADPDTPAGTFWALRDVSFDVQPGESVGIIGRNGAGKSTLLKILSRITAPTAGRITMRGRISSLLEVGTGFHPELTGRENTYLNGAILGMSKREIDAKFDEIVAFAEVERFIDTPVKRYSTGMQVRLGFAVAAHLEPEILVVDEVLSVGDAEFQRKCLGKMDDVAQQGRTVLFVSHNMGAVGQLCQSAVLIDHGRIQMRGEAQSVISNYVSDVLGTAEATAVIEEDETLRSQIRQVAVIDADGKPRSSFDMEEPIHLSVQGVCREQMRDSHLWIVIRRAGSDVLTSYDTDSHESLLMERAPGAFSYRISLPGSLLKPGLYTANLGMGIFGRGIIHRLDDIVAFNIVSKRGSTSFKGYGENRPGHLADVVSWNPEDASVHAF